MRLLMVLVVFGWFSVSVEAADVAAGKALYATCAACHGPNGGGNKAMNSPKIAGQHGWYVKRQLQAFKDGIRGTASGDVYGAQMRPMSMMLANEAAIDNVVAYIGSLSAPIPPVTIKGDAAVGKQLYVTCAACHGAKGEGNVQLNSPRLTDQDDWYLVRQLQNYKSGVRGSNPKDVYGMQMKPMAGMLANEQAINNLVAYIGTLK